MNKTINLNERYGENSWVVITGPSNGIGKQFAIQFAQLNFNLLLIGSRNIFKVEQEIREFNKDIQIKSIIKDFCKANEADFFDDIEKEINKIGYYLGIMINCVAHRTGWIPYHEMPSTRINDSIICGTIVQAQMTKIVIPWFLKRAELEKPVKSALIDITSLCTSKKNLYNKNNIITIPYLSVYEATKAFTYHHSCSIYEEYRDKFDHLIVMTGAVITNRTKSMLSIPRFSPIMNNFINNTLACTDIVFVGNVIKLLGKKRTSVWIYRSQNSSLFEYTVINVICKKDYSTYWKRTGRTMYEEL